MKENLRGVLALSPVVVLLGVYLVGSLLLGDFYAIPIASAFVVAAVYGIAVTRGYSLQERIGLFSQGASHRDIMYMIWIFCLAGIFATTAKSVGAVDATVALTLQIVPSNLLPAGIFIASCFISMAVGTSVGTIVALTPVVHGLSAQVGCDMAWLVAIVVGGAFFGDNLSFISDTTIAATQTQGCRMKDKFRTNFFMVLPAALLMLAIYLFGSGAEATEVVTPDASQWVKALPYLLVILLALTGMDVLLVLLLGTLATYVVGFACGSLAVAEVATVAGQGLASMYELILVTMLAGGVMALVKAGGGFDLLIRMLTRTVKGRQGTEAVISLLTALTNLCTANNTIAILTVGPIARDLAQRYGVEPRRSASLMDTTSCFVQGVIPYGAQLLMASGLAGISPVEIIPHLYYPMFIGAMVVLSVLFGGMRWGKA